MRVNKHGNSRRSSTVRLALAAAVSSSASLFVMSCGDRVGPTALIPDESDPTVAIAAADTVFINDALAITLAANDNLSLKTIRITVGDSLPFILDTTITFTSTQIQFAGVFNALVDSGAGQFLTITATVTDGANNQTSATASVFVFDPAGLSLTILVPPDPSVAAPGKTILITIRGQSPEVGVGKIGYLTTGVFASVDTATAFPITDPQVKDTTVTFTVDIPAATPLGFFTIEPFGRDSLGGLGVGVSVTVEVVASTGIGDTIPPIVTDSLSFRSERTDSVRITATDVGGISRVGFVITDITTGATLAGDSADFPGTATVVSLLFGLGLDTITVGTSARLVGVAPFAIDSVGNRGGLSRTGLPVAAAVGGVDTVTIVEGITVPLPSGGRVADAIYNRNLNELYLTNVDLDRLEIFDVATESFDPNGINVGSRPWGIALWPNDTLGANADTVLVANSGGTNISVVDVLNRVERRRHALPNFLIQEVDFVIGNTGALELSVTTHDFSDRPQFLASVCRVTDATTTCHADSVYAVYSTTPTIDQTRDLFELRGTIRWENISTTVTPQSHFFWEHAAAVAGLAFDTLQIVAKRGLTPDTILSGACGQLVSVTELAYLDTTFVRNSGNFTHALIGEGGVGEPVRGFARALRYRLADIVTATCTATIGGVTFTGGFQEDLGVSPSVDISDFISNTAIGIKFIAVNFNGLTNLVRADSIYVLDEQLRLTGTIGALGANPGMDLNFDHAFDAKSGGTPGTFSGTLDPNDRLVFAARDNANIDVFDTWFFDRVATVPVRDPIIGPLRVARLPTGEQFLIGVSARGVITVTLPAITNLNPSNWWGAAPGF